MAKKSKKSLITRLIILKYTFNEALNYLSDTTNDYGFAVGASLLHDSVENLFWTIGQENKISLRSDFSFIKIFDTLAKNLGKELAFDKTSIVDFNKIRVSYKHNALLPNVIQASSITDKIIEDFYQSVKNIFKIDLDSISLSQLIHDKRLRQEIEDIEKKLFEKKKPTPTFYRNLLFGIGKVYFEYFEKNYAANSLRELLLFQEEEKERRYKFPKRRVEEISRDLLELSLTPYLYWRFKNLVPTFGIDTKDNRTVPKMDTIHWGRENWTQLNVKFCLNWLIDYALKRQWLYDNSQYQLTYTRRIHILTPKKSFKVKLRDYKNKVDVEFSFQPKVNYLGYFLYYVDGIWQSYDEDDEGELFTIYCDGQKFHGRAPRNIFDIKETYVDDIPKMELRLLTLNARKAIKKSGG